MADRSPIEWTEATWNPVRGCTKISAGCKHCYAERFAERFRGVPGHPFEQGFDVRLVPEALELPLHWRKPRRIFVNSMSDLFHEDVPDTFVARSFAVMHLAFWHTYQTLTKRAERLRDVLGSRGFQRDVARIAEALGEEHNRRASRRRDRIFAGPVPWPLPNVWLGVSVEDQRAADERIPDLLATPAAVRFLSCEPLLGPVGLMPWLGVKAVDPITPGRRPLDWVIAGGESGPGARRCDVAWVRSLVLQCRAGCVPAFVKQLGAHVEDRNDAGFDGDDGDAWPAGTDVEHDEAGTDYQGAPVRVRLRDRKGGDMQEWPADLRVRQMPTTTTGDRQP